MAVRVQVNPNQSIEDSPKHYFGKSTDAKPTIDTTKDLPLPTVGSDFLETDTGIVLITGDGNNWVLEPNLKAMIDLSKAITALKETLSKMALDTARIRKGHEVLTWGQEIEAII